MTYQGKFSPRSAFSFPFYRTLLDKAVAITPGKVSPTICPLENPDWVSVKVVHSKKGENDAMDQLESIGAVAIVVTNINNVRG